jgi:hypothetical protein
MRRKDKPNKVKAKSVRKIFLWGVVVVAVALQIYVTIQTAGQGAQLAEMEKKEKVLLKDNYELTEKIVSSSSLASVEESAQQLGFREPQKTIYVTKESSVAKIP